MGKFWVGFLGCWMLESEVSRKDGLELEVGNLSRMGELESDACRKDESELWVGVVCMEILISMLFCMMELK